MPELETTLSEITVYPDRARVKRGGEIGLETGVQQIEIQNLPLTLNPDSARASARGTARARLMGLQIQRAIFAETPAEQARELEAKIEALQDEITAVEARAELIKQSRAKVDALGSHTEVFATALAAGETSVDKQLAVFDGLRQRADELDAEGLQLQAKRREMDRKMQQLKRQLDLLRSARPRERYTALVEVEVLSAGNLTVELEYVVSHAGWKPLYDLRLTEENDKATLEIGYLAQVTQQSGENWENTTLTLSTARPALAIIQPELDPWYIGLPQPPRPMALRAMAAAPAPMAAKAVDMMMVPAPGQPAEAAEVEEAMAAVDTSGTAVTYHVSGMVNIPSDGAPHKVTVARYPLSPRLDYVTAPKLTEAVYRHAKATNDSPYTLLAGAANLFAEDEFLGTTSLELVAPQGEIELYLGADDRIKVERELKRREMEKTLIGGKRRIHIGYEIRLENMLTRQAQITVHDQFPVSQHVDIKVKLEASQPPPTKQTELNLLDWELSLAPKEKRTLRFDFVVEYPPEFTVAGLPT